MAIQENNPRNHEGTQQESNARKKLKEMLQRETRGSIKVQAIADSAALEEAEARFSILKGYRRPDIAELSRASAELAAIQETVRGKRVGENSAEYIKMFDDKHIFTIYSIQFYEDKEQRKDTSYYTDDVKRIKVAKLLSKDIEVVNAQLPKRTDTPVNP